MASTSEVGHAKNVANFYSIISSAQGYGTSFNPAKDSLKIPQLQALYEQAKTNLTTVQSQKTLFEGVVNSRALSLKTLKPCPHG